MPGTRNRWTARRACCRSISSSPDALPTLSAFSTACCGCSADRSNPEPFGQWLRPRRPAQAELDAACRQEVVLRVAQLALGDRRSLVVEVAPIEPDLEGAAAVGDTGIPGDVGGGDRVVAPVEVAAAGPAR